MNSQLIDHEGPVKPKSSPFGWVALICLAFFNVVMIFTIYLEFSKHTTSFYTKSGPIISVCILLIGFMIGLIGLFVKKYSRTLPVVIVCCYVFYFMFLAFAVYYSRSKNDSFKEVEETSESNKNP